MCVLHTLCVNYNQSVCARCARACARQIIHFVYSFIVLIFLFRQCVCLCFGTFSMSSLSGYLCALRSLFSIIHNNFSHYLRCQNITLFNISICLILNAPVMSILLVSCFIIQLKWFHNADKTGYIFRRSDFRRNSAVVDAYRCNIMLLSSR